MAKNIRFHYLYRDSGNYKKFGSKDFLNSNNLSLNEIKSELEKHLIDGMFFYPERVGIEKFEFHRYCEDYSWYEMEYVELIVGRKLDETINDFIRRLENFACQDLQS